MDQSKARIGFLPDRADVIGRVRETWRWLRKHGQAAWRTVLEGWRKVWLALQKCWRAPWLWLMERGWPTQFIDKITNPPRWIFLLCFLVLVAIAVPLFFVWLPVALVDGRADDLHKLLLAAAGLASVPFFIWRAWIADGQRKTGNEAHFRDFLKNAVDQLGAERKDGTSNIEHRIGAIYALEKLARDCKPLHWPVMEILCSYVKRHAPISVIDPWLVRPVREDVQVALTVIGRRSEMQRRWEADNSAELAPKRLKLMNCCLHKAELDGLNFDHADFRSSNMCGATLEKTQFRKAYLNKVILDGETVLTGADFEEAILEGAYLEGATFKEAKLCRAELKSALLRGAYLDNAIGLELQQLEAAHGDGSTGLPSYIDRKPASWEDDGDMIAEDDNEYSSIRDG